MISAIYIGKEETRQQNNMAELDGIVDYEVRSCGLGGTFSFDFVLTQALYETGNEIIQDGTEKAHVRRNECHKRSPLSTTGMPRLHVAFP